MYYNAQKYFGFPYPLGIKNTPYCCFIEELNFIVFSIYSVRIVHLVLLQGYYILYVTFIFLSTQCFIFILS